MKLHFKVSGEGHPFIILHGLFGSLDNWVTLAKRFSEHYRVYIVDQRNHGKSPHSNEMDYSLMSNDLLELMQHENMQSAYLAGHSLGGKVAIQFALEHPGMVDKLVIADIAPKSYPAGHVEILSSLVNLDLTGIKKREEADALLMNQIPDATTRQFLLKNLGRGTDGVFYWKMNINGIYKNYEKIIAGVKSNYIYNGPACFIRGEKSGYIADEDRVQIRKLFPNVELVTVEKAGHWVHADAPDSFFRVVMDFLG